MSNREHGGESNPGAVSADEAALVEKLRASRSRLVAAAVDERLELERELHDGAQQRLMALQIKLALLRERVADPENAAALDELAADAAAAVEELRAVAHAIYPTVLRERGIADAVRSLARRSAARVEVVDEGGGRHDPVVEAAIYHSVAEAIRCAAPGARVAVTLGRAGGEAVFSVLAEAAIPDALLVSMRDRIEAVGGKLEGVSPSHDGVVLRGRVPARGAATAVG